jgi:hypothetical protein
MSIARRDVPNDDTLAVRGVGPHFFCISEADRRWGRSSAFWKILE